MGANAEERLLKRRINEIEDKVKKLQRELQRLKSFNRNKGRGQKEIQRAQDREQELQEFLAYEEMEARSEAATVENKAAPQCPKCNSPNVREIMAGAFKIIVCDECGAKRSFKLENEVKRGA
jgi:hypothetical protein